MEDRGYWYKCKNWIHMGFPYDRTMVMEAKKIPTIAYNHMNKEWYVENSISRSTLILDFIKRYGLKRERREFINFNPPPFEEKVSGEDIKIMIDSLPLKRKPRPYQIEGVRYNLNHYPCINGDACGLGKTAQALLTVEALNAFPVLVVCPLSVKTGWVNEWGRWRDRRISIIDSRNRENDWGADVCIINYDILSPRSKTKQKLKYRELSKIKWKCVIFDEIHFLKNEKSSRTIASSYLVKKVPFVFGLSGTLILNRPSELKSPLKVLGRFNSIFGESIDFYCRYCNAHRTTFGMDKSGSSNLQELYKKLTYHCYIRREKEDVLQQLPPLIENYVECEIDNAKDYEKAKNDFITYLSELSPERVSRVERSEALVKMSELRGLSVKGKVESITHWIKDWLESNEGKLLVFGVRREPLQLLAQRVDGLLLQGGLSTERREFVMDQFLNRKDKRVLCGNIQSMGTGVDGLQSVCSDTIFVEFSDRPSDLEQAISRLYRSGQTLPVSVSYLMSRETIDKNLYNVLIQKRKVVNGVNSGSFNEEDLFEQIYRDIFQK